MSVTCWIGPQDGMVVARAFTVLRAGLFAMNWIDGITKSNERSALRKPVFLPMLLALGLLFYSRGGGGVGGAFPPRVSSDARVLHQVQSLLNGHFLPLHRCSVTNRSRPSGSSRTQVSGRTDPPTVAKQARLRTASTRIQFRHTPRVLLPNICATCATCATCVKCLAFAGTFHTILVPW